MTGQELWEWSNLYSTYRPNVPFGPVFWWYLHHIWRWSIKFCGSGSRRSNWSHGLRISTYDQMHIPQIRNIRWNWKTWCPVYSPPEHFQWKDLHIFMVLDAHSHCSYIPCRCLPGLDHLFRKCEDLSHENPVQTSPDRVHRGHHGKVHGGRLVPHVFAWTKYWSSDL